MTSAVPVSVVAASDYTRFIPRTNRGKRGVILFHGLGNPNEYLDSANQPASVQLAYRIASEGIPCIAGAFSGDTWGNDQSKTDTANAFTALQAMGAAADAFIGFGVSMGHANLLRYAIDNPTKVAAGIGAIPIIDLVGVYNNNIHSSQASIATAWGVTAPAALPARADLLTTATALAGKPWWLGYSTADTWALPAPVTSLATKIGASCVATAVSTSLDHSDAVVGLYVNQIIPVGASSSLISFLIANGA
jgi:hypothetical protein